MRLNIAVLCALLLLSVAFAACGTTVYVGDTLAAQGYSVTLDNISAGSNGTAVGIISAYYDGIFVGTEQINQTTGIYSFTNPLDGTTITITDCQNVPGANGYAQVAITGLNFTLVPGAMHPRNLPMPSQVANLALPNVTVSPSSGISSADFIVYTSAFPNGTKVSLPLGQSVQAGGYNLKLVGSPRGDTASVEVTDSQGNSVGTYDVSSGSSYTVPTTSSSSPLTLSLQTISGAEGSTEGASEGAVGSASPMVETTGTGAAQPPAAAPQAAPVPPTQQSSQVGQLIEVLVIFIGMIIASFIVLYQLSRNTVSDPTMKLFENETRLGIVKQLAEADRIPTDLANSLDKSKAAVVEHLDILMSQGLVERLETPGKKFVFYRLTQKGKQALLRMAG